MSVQMLNGVHGGPEGEINHHQGRIYLFDDVDAALVNGHVLLATPRPQRKLELLR